MARNCCGCARAEPAAPRPPCPKYQIRPLAIKTAIAALEGDVIPQTIKLPLAVASDPDFKEGVDYFPGESDNFFVGNSFPTCNINFTAQEIMGQSQDNE